MPVTGFRGFRFLGRPENNVEINYYAAYSATNWLIWATFCLLFTLQTKPFVYVLWVIFSLYFHSLGGAYCSVCSLRGAKGVFGFSHFRRLRPFKNVMSPPQTPCFVPGPATQTSVDSHLNSLSTNMQSDAYYRYAGFGQIG